MRHIFTVDVEDWYHGFPPDYSVPQPRVRRLESGMRFLLDSLEEAGVKATFFWLASEASLFPQLLRESLERGHEIGSHGLRHSPIFKMSPAAFSADTDQALSIISDITGSAVFCYRAPYFSINNNTFWALEILASFGITHDSSILPMRHWRTGMPEVRDHIQIISTPSGSITEVPITTRSFFGLQIPICGGGYFRAYPYKLSSANIKLRASFERPAVFYIHPWELDPHHPYVNQHTVIDRMHYLGLGKTQSKLKRLLRDHSFGPLIDIANESLRLLYRAGSEADEIETLPQYIYQP